MEGGMPLLLSAVWLTTAGLIYNPLGAWLHDKVNSRRGMYMIGFVGIIISMSCLAAMTAQYAGTTNKVGNGFGIFFIYLYLAFQGTFCDTNVTFRRFPRPKSVQLVRASPSSVNLLPPSSSYKLSPWASAKLAGNTILSLFAGLHSSFQLDEEVAVDLTGVTDEEKVRLDHHLVAGENVQSSMSSELEKETKPSSTNEAEQNVLKVE
ncbi:hypothetical protein N7465_009617 [Penicillium sp. CMV-2018d]|nr:hypothetical protein N7465_009617 [Penicillium sp. CMV-2018d]